MEKADFERLLDNQRKAFNNLLNGNYYNPNIQIVDFPKTPPNLNMEFLMGTRDNIKWIVPNIPTREPTPEEIEEKRIQDKEWEEQWGALRKERALQYEKFGVKGIGALVKELNDLTGAGMVNCKICLDKAIYECTTYTKDALFKTAIEFLKKLRPIYK